MTLWRVPAEWAGETAFILGGGESLKGFDAERLRGQGRVVAINEAGLTLCPWADVLFFADGLNRWLGWNQGRLPLFRGGRIVTRAKVPASIAELHGLHVLKHLPAPAAALSRRPEAVAGFCGGSSAINLAFLFGARRIVLLGFDMAGGNFHDRHKLPNARPDFFRSQFIPALERMAPELAAEGCRVINATPETALDCFEKMDLEEVLADG